MIYNNIDRKKDAAEAFFKAFALGGFEALHADLGDAYLLLRQYEKSAEEYRLSLENDEPHPLKSMCNLGANYIYLEEYVKAISIYEQAIHKNPQASIQYNAHNNLAVAYQMTGRYGDALNMYEVSLSNNPDDLITIYNIGLMYIKLNEIEKAVRQIQLLQKYDAKNASILLRELHRVRPEVLIPENQ